jgi:hypothetical protein
MASLLTLNYVKFIVSIEFKLIKCEERGELGTGDETLLSFTLLITRSSKFQQISLKDLLGGTYQRLEREE